MCLIMMVEEQYIVRLSSLAEGSTVVLLVWMLWPEVSWQRASRSLHTVPLCLISSSQDADYRGTVQACTFILLRVRDSMDVHLPPQRRRYAQSHYYATHCNRIAGRFLLQHCSVCTASLDTDGNRLREQELPQEILTHSFLPVDCIVISRILGAWLQKEQIRCVWVSVSVVNGSTFCVSWTCFRGMWHQRQTSKKEVWIWPLNSPTEGKEAQSVLRELISYVNKKLTCRCLPAGFRNCQTWLSGVFLCLPDRLPVHIYKYRNTSQGIKKCAQIQWVHLTLTRMEAALLSRASSHLWVFCLSHQWVWLRCWSSETELMKLCFYTLTVKRQHQPSIQIPALFSGLHKPNLIRSWIHHK